MVFYIFITARHHLPTSTTLENFVSHFPITPPTANPSPLLAYRRIHVATIAVNNVPGNGSGRNEPWTCWGWGGNICRAMRHYTPITHKKSNN